MKTMDLFKPAYKDTFDRYINESADLTKVCIMFKPHLCQVGNFYKFTIPGRKYDSGRIMPEESLIVVAVDVRDLEICENHTLVRIKAHETIFRIISYSGKGNIDNLFMSNGYVFYESSWDIEELKTDNIDEN